MSVSGEAGNGFRIPGIGQLGGQSIPLNKRYIHRGKEQIEIKNPHVIQYSKTGDVLISTRGGGGVDPPEEPEPEAVRTDVKKRVGPTKNGQRCL